MAKKNYTIEQKILKLREMEILLGQGKMLEEALRQVEIGDATYYRWKKACGGMTTSDAKRLKALEIENARLKRIVAEQTLDIAILKDVNSKNF